MDKNCCSESRLRRRDEGELESYFSRISLLLVTCCWFGISRLSLLYSPLLAAWSSCFASPSDFASSGIFLGPQTSRAAIIAPIMTTSHGSIKDMIGPADLSCLAYDFLVHIIQTRMVRYDQVRPLPFYVVAYGFHLLRIFPKKLDQLCDLVNSDWLNVVLNSFRILMRRYLLHSDKREKF